MSLPIRSISKNTAVHRIFRKVGGRDPKCVKCTQNGARSSWRLDGALMEITLPLPGSL